MRSRKCNFDMELWFQKLNITRFIWVNGLNNIAAIFRDYSEKCVFEKNTLSQSITCEKTTQFFEQSQFIKKMLASEFCVLKCRRKLPLILTRPIGPPTSTVSSVYLYELPASLFEKTCIWRFNWKKQKWPIPFPMLPAGSFFLQGWPFSLPANLPPVPVCNCTACLMTMPCCSEMCPFRSMERPSPPPLWRLHEMANQKTEKPTVPAAGW